MRKPAIPTSLTRRERAFRRIVRMILSTVLPEGLFLRLYWRFLRWLTRGHV